MNKRQWVALAIGPGAVNYYAGYETLHGWRLLKDRNAKYTMRHATQAGARDTADLVNVDMARYPHNYPAGLGRFHPA